MSAGEFEVIAPSTGFTFAKEEDVTFTQQHADWSEIQNSLFTCEYFNTGAKR